MDNRLFKDRHSRLLHLFYRVSSWFAIFFSVVYSVYADKTTDQLIGSALGVFSTVVFYISVIFQFTFIQDCAFMGFLKFLLFIVLLVLFLGGFEKFPLFTDNRKAAKILSIVMAIMVVFLIPGNWLLTIVIGYTTIFISTLIIGIFALLLYIIYVWLPSKLGMDAAATGTDNGLVGYGAKKNYYYIYSLFFLIVGLSICASLYSVINDRYNENSLLLDDFNLYKCSSDVKSSNKSFDISEGKNFFARASFSKHILSTHVIWGSVL